MPLFLEIADRPATWQEALRLMGAGWGSIFIVILIIMLTIALLGAAGKKRK